MPHNILMVVEVAEELLGVFVDIIGLLQEARAQEVIENLSQLRVALEIIDMLFLDSMLNGTEISL